MKKKLRSVLWLISGASLIAGCILIFTSCEKLVFSGEGPVMQKTLNFEYFCKLTFYDIFDVELKSDPEFSIQLASAEKFIDHISIREDSGEIICRDLNDFKWFPDYPRPKLTISFPSLDDQILLKSPVRLYSADTLHLDQLRLILTGKTGEFDLVLNVKYFYMVTGSDDFGFSRFTGRADNAYLWPRGSAQADASGLICKECMVYNNSIGDCYVYASEKLEVMMNTAGNIYYKGNPAEITITEQSGTGRLIHLDE